MKIAVFDIDGTLLFPSGIAEADIAAIRDWQADGHLAVAATGKSLASLDHALAPYDLRFDYSVVFTGAGVTDREGRYIGSSTIPSDVVRSIVTPLVDDPSVAVYATTLHGRDALLSARPADLRGHTILQDVVPMSVAELDEHEFACLPVWVPRDHERQVRMRDQLIATHPELGVQINQSFLDIIPAGTDKAVGMQVVLDHLGLARGEATLYVFGDSWNDLDLYRIADRSYSFPWSPDEVMDAADEVIESVAPTLQRLRKSLASSSDSRPPAV